ncbi:MAG: hypothetical protein E7I16_00305, partial [Veillonella sp.]|nr:hypothetical protein [Veillonella sp.]
AIQKFIQTYIIFKERVILQIVKLFFHNNLTDSINIYIKYNFTLKKIKFQYFYIIGRFYDNIAINSKKN